jgi:hypothetical protein
LQWFAAAKERVIWQRWIINVNASFMPTAFRGACVGASLFELVCSIQSSRFSGKFVTVAIVRKRSPQM